MGRSKGSVHRPAHQPMTNTLPKVVTGAGGVGTGGCAGVLGAEAGSSARAGAGELSDGRGDRSSQVDGLGAGSK